MTRDPDDRFGGRPDDGLDENLRAHLRANVPGHRAGFWEDLEATLAATPQESPEAARADVQGTVLPLRPSARQADQGAPPDGHDPHGGRDMERHDTGGPASLLARRTGHETGHETDLGSGDRWGPDRASTRGRGGWWAAAAAAAVVLATATGVGLALRGAGQDGGPVTSAPVATRGTGGASPTATAGTDSSPATTTPTATGTGSSDRFPLVEVPGAEAVTLMRAAGPDGGVRGTPRIAWTWTDATRTYLLLGTVEEHRSTESGGDGATFTRRDSALTRVYFAGGPSLDDLKPLRTMTDDNGGTCDVDFGAAFTYGSVTAFDADDDGVSEVTVGWDWICRGDPGPSQVKLAMLSGTDKYILRGSGILVASDAGDGLGGFDFPPAEFTPEPAAAQWPGDSYARVTKLFRALWK